MPWTRQCCRCDRQLSGVVGQGNHRVRFCALCRVAAAALQDIRCTFEGHSSAGRSRTSQCEGQSHVRMLHPRLRAC